MDSYDFNVCVQKADGDVWEFTVAQEFDENEVEMLTFGEAESQDEALRLAAKFLQEFNFNPE